MSVVKYDFIFAGAGLSGLTLAVQMHQKGLLEGKKVLLLDADRKEQNDRTWCFWATPQEVEAMPPVIFRRWDGCFFYSKTQNGRLDTGHYAYYMVQAKDFYAWAKQQLEGAAGVEWRQEKITALDADTGRVATTEGRYEGIWVFNSALVATALMPTSEALPFRMPFTLGKKVVPAKYSHLLQHFKGWVVETSAPAFDPACATLMDFRIPQEGETRFVYVLPLSERSALVEFTVFSPKVLAQEEYDVVLENYLRQYCGATAWEVHETEFGVIPMTDFPFKQQQGRVIHIGTPGGQVKPSSGYAFKRVQERMEHFVLHWKQKGAPNVLLLRSGRRFRVYDSIFLRALSDRLVPGDAVFSAFFSRLGGAGVFRFLDEKSHFLQDLKALYSVPTLPFLKAFARQINVLFKV